LLVVFNQVIPVVIFISRGGVKTEAMEPTVLVIATLDTKETETAYLQKQIEAQGIRTLLMDTGILAAPKKVKPAVTQEEVAQAGGMELKALLATGDKGKCIATMLNGARNVALRLYAEGKFNGVIGLGGAQGTNIATAVMQALPFGVPKLMVSTIACGTATFGPFVGTKDVTMMHSVVDVQGLNTLSTRVLQNAAAAICGMVKSFWVRLKEKSVVGRLLCRCWERPHLAPYGQKHF